MIMMLVQFAAVQLELLPELFPVEEGCEIRSVGLLEHLYLAVTVYCLKEMFSESFWLLLELRA